MSARLPATLASAIGALMTEPDLTATAVAATVVAHIADLFGRQASASLLRTSSPRRPFVTLASSHPSAERADAAQRLAGEGPCLDAVTSTRPILVGDLASDPRWPALARPVESPVMARSVISVQICAPRFEGSLNVYCREPGVFADGDGAAISMAADTAGLGLAAAGHREDARHLEIAVTANRRIGVAAGILMARGNCSYDQAFAAMVDRSQRSQRKLRDVAGDVVYTGTLD